MERLGLRRGASAVWALNAALVAGALAVYRQVDALPAPAGAAHVPWWGLAIAFALTEVAVVHVHFRRGAHTLTLAELPLALGLLFAAPRDLILGWVIGAGVVLAMNRGLPRVRLVFNLGQLGVTAGIAAAFFHAVSGPIADPGPRVWAAAVAAVLLAAVVSVVLVGAAMWLSGDGMRPRKLGAMVGMAVAVAATNASLGLAAGTVIGTDPRGAILLLAPAAAIFLAYRAYTSEQRQRTNLEFLHKASRTLTTAADTAPGVAGMLAMALETFRGEVAEVAMLPAGDDANGRRITVGPAEHLEIMRPLSASVTVELEALIKHDHTARILTPEAVGGALATHLRRLGAREAMLAPLPGERRMMGAMLMVNRLGTGDSFGREDVKLFETLAHQTGAALGQDRLTTKVSELRDLQVQLEHQAFHDPLTGLANRLLFMDRVEHTLQRRTGNAVVLFLDLDDFKPINDTYGHEAGDAVLVAAAERLRSALRTADTAARLGGDEFAVLLVDIADEHIAVVADRIVTSLVRPLEFDGRELQVKASLGVAAASSGSGVDADELVRKADVAMYVSKHGGKGRLSHFDPQAA
jgi:diguanylate cyclase (GGDEF)-like protein